MDTPVDAGHAAAIAGTDAAMAEPFIRFEDVSLRYGGAGVVSNSGMSLYGGEKVASQGVDRLWRD